MTARQYTPSEVSEIHSLLNWRQSLVAESKKLDRKDTPYAIIVQMLFEPRPGSTRGAERVEMSSDGAGPTAQEIRDFLVSYFVKEIGAVDAKLLALGMELVA